MDIWVVAAAAGAGYIAQHWKNILKGRQDFPRSSTESPSFAVSEKNGPLRRVVSGEQLGEDSYSEREASLVDIPVVEMASTSGCEVENLSILDMSCGVLSDNLQGGREKVSEDLLPQPSTGEMGFSYDSVRRKQTLRTQRSKRQLIKPLSSLESCLMAQLYNEDAEIEDYVFNFVDAPRAPIRSFLVTDGSEIISRAVEKQADEKAYSEGETVYGVPQLPKIKSPQEQVERSSSCDRIANGKHRKLQGSSNGALLFCLGISVGILSSFLGNRQEVHKLNELLKQTENLVQDLQEELEMKDSLTVKELTVEDYGSQDMHNDKPCSPEHKLDESTEHDHGYCQDEKAEDKSMSRIEAELEAELEMLELSIKSGCLEGKLTDFVEPYLDFVPDVAVGELRADLFGRKAEAQHYADEDGSGSSTVHTANYAVSPRELSLRLHEVVQSQLEERVKELETALENSQKKIALQNSQKKVKKYFDHDHIINSWRNLSSSEAGSSAQRSPVNNNDEQQQQLRSDHPVVINLSGEALDAYNEAYDLFARINDSEEDKSSKSPHQNQEDSLNNGIQSYSGVNIMQPLVASESREEEVQNTLSNDMVTSGDESDRDEMEEMLIKHIVEKAKKSSSIILNAQRLLFSNDEN